VAKAVGHPIAKYASLLMSGKTLSDIGFTEEPRPKHVSVKEVVLPFNKFPGADTLLVRLRGGGGGGGCRGVRESGRAMRRLFGWGGLG